MKKGCDIKTLAGYSEFDELRLINNCIKHNGVVDKKLSGYSNWNEGDKLSKLYFSYNRLKNGVNDFILAVRDQVLIRIV